MWAFYDFGTPESFETTCELPQSYLCSQSITIEPNCGKCVFWFCSSEIEAEAKIHEGTRSILILSSFQQLHKMLEEIQNSKFLAFEKYILISPDGEMECTQVFLVI